MPKANKGYSFKPLSENVSRNLSNKNLTPKQEKKERKQQQQQQTPKKLSNLEKQHRWKSDLKDITT